MQRPNVKTFAPGRDTQLTMTSIAHSDWPIVTSVRTNENVVLLLRITLCVSLYTVTRGSVFAGESETARKETTALIQKFHKKSHVFELF